MADTSSTSSVSLVL